MAVNLLNLADRQGLAAVAPAIKLDLALTDTELGLILGLGFAIFYSLLDLPIARLRWPCSVRPSLAAHGNGRYLHTVSRQVKILSPAGDDGCACMSTTAPRSNIARL